MDLSKKFGDVENCPVRQILSRIGDKWSVLIILILGQSNVMRFNELNRAIGDISQKMLTVTLRNLEADGLVTRTIFPEIPPRVEYKLTPLGRSLLPHIVQLTTWAQENFSNISNARKRFAG